MPDIPSAGDSALESWQRSEVVSALGTLPARQREALVLRYYAGLPGPQAAAVMGISEGAVKRHIWRALTSLRAALDTEPSRPRGGRPADRHQAVNQVSSPLAGGEAGDRITELSGAGPR